MSQVTRQANQDKKYAPLILNALFLIVFAWIAYRAFYDLFVFEPGVNFPRVELNQNIWGKTVVHFTLNTPTATSIVIFCAALVSIYASVMIFVVTFFSIGKRAQTYWKVQAASFLICLISYAIQVYDFMSNAFDGVG